MLRNFLWFIAAFVAMFCIVAAGAEASPADVTPVPVLRTAHPAAQPSLRDLLRKCAAGNKAACAALDRQSSGKSLNLCTAPAKSLLFIKRFDCGGGGLPYCDQYELGTVLYATWYSLPVGPGYPYWHTGNFRCSYGSAASVERTWAIQTGLDPDSGPGKFWLDA